MRNSGRRNFLKGVAVGAASLTLGDVPADALADATVVKRGKLPRAEPESLGISSAAILSFVDAVNEKVGGLHSFMLLRHGKVAAEGWWTPYKPGNPHMLFSLSKSFTSTAVGLAVTDGKLTVEDKVISFFPDSLPAKMDPNLAEMRVKHLLTMSTGHDKDATGGTAGAKDGDWVKAFLALPVENAPGSKFVYNSAATYMCSAIVQKLVGKPIVEYLKPRLFDPLGIQGQTWESCPKGINCGGWGLSIKTEDIALFGQLYLQKGKWDGKQLVPEKWVDQATTKHISNGDPATPNDWAQGYGYQFWRARHNFYRGDGAFGQYCIVMPDRDAILAITSGVGDMGAVMNAAWDFLLPGMPQEASNPSADKADELKTKLKDLKVPPPEGQQDSPTAKRVSGKTYRMDTNDSKIQSATVRFEKSHCTLILRNEAGEQPIISGSTSWVPGVTTLESKSPSKIATRGAWTADDTYTMKVCFVETPFIQTITCKFTDDQVTITRKANVGFGNTDRPTLTGKTA